MRNNKRVVLMVEDDKKLREVLTKFLSRNDYEVLAAENGKVGLELFYENSKNLDIVLLDGMLPDIDGADVLKEIREHSQVPVIMLTARESEEDQLNGLNNGADNYITKPFLMKVLLVHMDKLIQRNSNEDTDVIEKGALKLEKQFRKAYINGSFTIEEYDNEKEIVENTIKILEEKIKECDLCNELKFTPEDILIKRDLDYINGLVYPKEYEENTYMWKDYTRSEKSDLIMRYVDYVELEYYSKNKVRIGEVYFRESMCKPCNELYDAGFLAKTDYALLGNIVTKLRFSEYLPIEKVSEIVFTLRQYYNVGYFEATYYYEDKVMFFNNYENRNIVRIFPIEDYKKMDKLDKLQLGVIYIGNNEKCLIDNKEDLFTTIPEKTNCRIYEFDKNKENKNNNVSQEQR